MAFDSKDTAAFKGVWVFCEQREGVIMSTSYQLLSEGRKLANDLGVELCGVVLGKDIKEDYLKALGGYGADKVYYCNHELLDVYTTDAYTKVICDLVEDKKPEIFLIGATNIGRDLGPRCAARLHTGLTADCTHLDVDVEKYKAFLKTTSTIDVDNTKFEENTNLKMTRPAFGGHLMATIICPRFRPQMSTVRPGVMQTQPYDEAGAAKTEIVNVDVKLDKSDIHVDVLEVKNIHGKMIIFQCFICFIRIGYNSTQNAKISIFSDAQGRKIDVLFCQHFSHFRQTAGLVFQKDRKLFCYHYRKVLSIRY